MKMKLLRISKGLTQDDLARLSGISRTTISKIERENEKCMKLGTLIKLAQVLDSTVQELFLKE